MVLKSEDLVMAKSTTKLGMTVEKGFLFCLVLNN